MHSKGYFKKHGSHGIVQVQQGVFFEIHLCELGNTLFQAHLELQNHELIFRSSPVSLVGLNNFAIQISYRKLKMGL